MTKDNMFIDVEVVACLTYKDNELGEMESWEGAAIIGDKFFVGEFAMVEEYEFDGITYKIDWKDRLEKFWWKRNGN